MRSKRLVLVGLLAGALVACDDGGSGTPDPADGGPDLIEFDGSGPVGDGAPPEGDGSTPVADQGPKLDSDPWPTTPCGFTVGDTLKGTVGDNQDFVIGGEARTFVVQLVNVPAGYNKKLPVIFGYHGTGLYRNIPTKYFKPVSENRPFIYVAPKGSGSFTDPYDFASDPKNSKDIKLFDDMLKCLSAQFDVDFEHIHAFGFSWGGHWINYMMAYRGDVLASAAQLSAGAAVPPLGSALEALLNKNKYHGAQIVLWGGPTDQYNGYSFEGASLATIESFKKTGHFVLKCVHDDGHDITPPESFNKFIFEFFQDHPRGVTSPYATNWPPPAPFTKGTYLNWPSWCTPVTP